MARKATDGSAEDVARLAPGQRVAIQGNPIGVTLNARTGTIVRPDEWDGYSIVQLDTPAIYRLAGGVEETLVEIREAEDNLAPLAALR